VKIILWADEPNNALGLRDVLREQKHVAMIRSAPAFSGVADAEQCDAIAFIDAGKADEIIAAYRSPSYQVRHGDVRVFDIETGKFGEPIAVPDLDAVVEEDDEPSEGDMLAARIANMSDDDLRTYARAVLNCDIDPATPRETIESMLREGKPGEGKPSPAGVAAVDQPPPPEQPQVQESASDRRKRLKAEAEAKQQAEAEAAAKKDSGAG